MALWVISFMIQIIYINLNPADQILLSIRGDIHTHLVTQNVNMMFLVQSTHSLLKTAVTKCFFLVVKQRA